MATKAAAAAGSNKPHVLLFPLPIQGHAPPMLKLAHLLSSSSDQLLITFLNTEHSHRRFSSHSPAFHHHLSPNFRFRTIPDGLPTHDPRQSLHFPRLIESMTTQSKQPFTKLLSSSDDWPPITCIIADAILGFAVDVAAEHGIPTLILRTSSACSLWAFRCLPGLIQSRQIPIPKGADLEEMIEGVEGMEGILRRRDLPSFCRDEEVNPTLLELASEIPDTASRGRALIMNTFESLETPMLSKLRSFCPAVYPIAPLHLLAPTSGSVSLWEEDKECLRWLDSQPDKSVVYVSFGSVVVMSREEQIELWHGLIDSGYRFLWVVRRDHDMAIAQMKEETEVRGCWLVTSCAPQEELLAHRAVGCFLTHGEWNSTVESVAAGVPMICWPFMTDQHVNSRFMSNVWRIGLEIVEGERGIIGKTIRDAMEGETAEELRRSAREMARKAKASVDKGGDSHRSLQMLVQHIMLLSSSKCLKR